MHKKTSTFISHDNKDDLPQVWEFMFTPIISSEGTKTVDEIASLFKFRFIIKYLLWCLCYGLIHQPGPVDHGKVDRDHFYKLVNGLVYIGSDHSLSYGSKLPCILFLPFW